MAWASILHALWLFLPAYVANMSPVFTAKLVPAWSHPIDGGRVHKDGKRVLGDGKTWRGLILGGVAAGLTAVGVAYGSRGWLDGWDYGLWGYCGAVGPVACDAENAAWWSIFIFGSIVGIFALAGDTLESYVKRRLGKDRGAPWFPFDQLDFVVFGLIGMLVASPLLPRGWVVEALTGDWVVLTTILVGTPALHLLVNRIGYWLRLKEVPW